VNSSPSLLIHSGTMPTPIPKSAAEKVSTYLSKASLSRLSPVPAFPEYSGLYKVGTVDVEIPVSELEAPSPAPGTAKNIHTVQFRIFYPAPADTKEKQIPWLPAPQRLTVSAYTQFLGVGPMLASVLS
jgi:platelet-activating factor acetylhydrolase